MEDLRGFGHIPHTPPAYNPILEWDDQGQFDPSDDALFTSDILNPGLGYHRHASDLPHGDLQMLDAQTFGNGTADSTNNQDLPFPDSFHMPCWNTSHAETIYENTNHVQSVTQATAKEPDFYMNVALNGSSSRLHPFGEQQSSSLFTCGHHGCTFHCSSPEEYNHHLSQFHTGDYLCHQCTKKVTSVEASGSRVPHVSFPCKYENCGKTFTRFDSYKRHERNHREDAKRFPCKYCKKFKGANGFKRKDHLMQHIRRYHHIDDDDRQPTRGLDNPWCHVEDCSHHRDSAENVGKQQAFSTSAEYINHVRTMHDQSPFPCPQPGCDRVNGRGYFREADLRTHLRKVHGMDGSLEDDRD